LRVGLTVISTSWPSDVRKFDQPADREVACAIAHQRGDVRLLDPEQLSGLRLRQAALLDDLVDLQGEGAP